MTPRLITIPISHYGERARWALDYAGVEYEEEHHIQLFSWFAAARHGRRKFLPVFVNGSEVLNDSGLILRWASSRAAEPLFPSDERTRAEVEALDEKLAGAYGVESRRVGYDWFFRSLDVCLPFNAGYAPAHEVLALDLAKQPIERFARWYLGVKPEQLRHGLETIESTLTEIADRLRDGRRYLFGDRFTAADLTFAAMSAPNLLPEKYGVPMPLVDVIPHDAAERIRRWRDHPAGAYAMRLYDERPPSPRRFVGV